MQRGNLPEAPNYTNAALVMGAVNLFWMLGVVLVVFGLPMVLATGFVLDRLICWWGQRG
ncbi:hypothetical protein [Roseovarius sp. 2305UL8-3]|uniref:hypothetical protein n=1 Tax=Roseovarius conchicola TaxID=3121636 RepID=UPI00352780ED